MNPQMKECQHSLALFEGDKFGKDLEYDAVEQHHPRIPSIDPQNNCDYNFI